MHTNHLVWVTLFWLASSGCESDFGDKTSGQACTRTAQCARGLVCREGLCAPKSKGKGMLEPQPDAGEAGADADMSELADE